jgi:hypothetical protein
MVETASGGALILNLGRAESFGGTKSVETIDNGCSKGNERLESVGSKRQL